MREVAEAIRNAVGDGRPTLVGRVIEVKGFSTLPVDDLVAIDSTGARHGDLLGPTGAKTLGLAAAKLFRSGGNRLETVGVEIHGRDVAEMGLSCGGRAEVLLQPVESIPAQLWSLLADRAPAALITRIEGAGAGPAAMVVDGHGNAWGDLDGVQPLLAEAVALLGEGRSTLRRVEDDHGVTLIEAWVPEPRLVVVGAGDMVEALRSQGALLGWDLRATDDPGSVSGLLDWAGATAALVVLSHDPHVDVPALRVGLDRKVPYVGAMGSRSTQSRRLDRLAADGVDAEALASIHRPIGLDLGGRRAPEVALAIAAEILACHCGRSGRPLREATGPIHDRPMSDQPA
ncbi:MAG: XdhC family protein [Acidimicrobiales bacterium]